MRKVTKENLTAQIDRLCKIKDEQGQLSMNNEYTLQAYKMLLTTLEAEPVAYSLIFRNTDGVLNNYINTNTVFATREKAEAYGKGGNYEERSDGGLEWVPNTALDPVVIPLYRHEQPVPAMVDELGFIDRFERIISERDDDIDIGQLGSANYDALMLAALDAFRDAMLNQK